MTQTARVVYIIVLCTSVLFAPFWATLAIAIVGIVFFEYAYDTLIILFISDLLYLEFYSSPTLFSFVLIGIVAYTITMLIKPKLLLS